MAYVTDSLINGFVGGFKDREATSKEYKVNSRRNISSNTKELGPKRLPEILVFLKPCDDQLTRKKKLFSLSLTQLLFVLPSTTNYIIIHLFVGSDFSFFKSLTKSSQSLLPSQTSILYLDRPMTIHQTRCIKNIHKTVQLSLNFINIESSHIRSFLRTIFRF